MDIKCYILIDLTFLVFLNNTFGYEHGKTHICVLNIFMNFLQQQVILLGKSRDINLIYIEKKKSIMYYV